MKSGILRDIFLCLCSATLLILSFPSYNIWIFAWFGFVPLFLSFNGKKNWQAFLLTYLTGVIFWSGIIYWLAHVTLPGTILLVLYLALYFGLFGLIIRPISRNSTPFALIFIPSVWVLLEYIRGWLFSGFPWALLGYSQYLNLPVIQISDITGVWGVSFLIMLVNVAIIEIVSHKLQAASHQQKLGKIIFITCVLCIVSCAYGFYKLNPKIDGNKIKVSVVQGNIPQELKWDEEYAAYILDKYSILTTLASEDKPDLIIWPEAAAPGILGEDDWVFQKIFSLAREIRIPLLVGAVVEEKGLYYGSALLVDAKGKIAGRYDKLHLVPFGEYIPLKNILPFLETVVPIGDIERGKEYTIFQATTKFAVLDCFEDVFPELAREFTKRGADFLVNITNDAWYKQTPAPYQHLQASVFRAAENRRYLARAANTGISCFIAPTGKIISLVQDRYGRNIFVNGYKTEELIITGDQLSFYSRHGDIFIAICLLIILYGIIIEFKNIT